MTGVLRWLNVLGMVVFGLGCVRWGLRSEYVVPAAACGALAWMVGGILGMFLVRDRSGRYVPRVPGVALGTLGAGLALLSFERFPWVVWFGGGLVLGFVACRATGRRVLTPEEREDQEAWQWILRGLGVRWFVFYLGGAVGLAAAVVFVKVFDRSLPSSWDVGALALGVLAGFVVGWAAGEYARRWLLNRYARHLLPKLPPESWRVLTRRERKELTRW